MFKKYLLVPVFLLLFFQVESCVDCSLLLIWFIFRFFWFTKFIILVTFLWVLQFWFWVLHFPCLSYLWFFFHPLPCEVFLEHPLQCRLCGHELLWLSLSWKVLISPSRLKDSFVGYSWLAVSLLNAWVTLIHAFLAFRVCAERTEVILMCLPLYVSWLLFFFQLLLSFLYSLVSAFYLYMIWRGVILFWSYLSGVWNASYTWISI
jgi:hypothetical protein